MLYCLLLLAHFNYSSPQFIAHFAFVILFSLELFLYLFSCLYLIFILFKCFHLTVITLYLFVFLKTSFLEIIVNFGLLYCVSIF